MGGGDQANVEKNTDFVKAFLHKIDQRLAYTHTKMYPPDVILAPSTILLGLAARFGLVKLIFCSDFERRHGQDFEVDLCNNL